ncbi:DUF1957 domain-containing protein [Myxococcota bacterium]|nr:DUF1957 domain-containing protein [Myxococcota bacterium]
MPTGSFVLALHGHMPWVLGHGRWPHGEHWLFEAALGVYLPLLGMVEEVHAAGARAGFTLGLTPVLLEQLTAQRFQDGFDRYLDDRLARARRDAQNPHLRHLAERWEAWFLAQQQRWRAAERDLPAAFGAHARGGRIELLTSLATHGYAPLLLHDASVRAQLSAGLAISERTLGFRPTGIWLPECAYRPAGPWTPPVLHGDSRNRLGVEQILAEQGVTHFFVDAHLARGALSEGLMDEQGFTRIGWHAASQDPNLWRNVMRPQRVGSHGGPSDVVAFARHPEVSETVWSGQVGYPGDGRYLEFHKKESDEGLRYWRVTGRDVGLGGKHLYDPDAIPGALHEHAQHFAHTVKRILAGHHAHTGHQGAVVATFDAELFGHWWFEGPRFLRDVLLTLHHDPDVMVQTARERRDSHPPEIVVRLPEGSWGEGGDHRVWFRDSYRWVWETAYRSEDRFLGLRWRVSQARGARQRRARPWLEHAARELLLLQSSDWPFVITTGGAVDYGWQRICGHQVRFDRCCQAVEDALAGRQSDPILKAELKLALQVDGWQQVVDPEWWRE